MYLCIGRKNSTTKINFKNDRVRQFLKWSPSSLQYHHLKILELRIGSEAPGREIQGLLAMILRQPSSSSSLSCVASTQMAEGTPWCLCLGQALSGPPPELSVQGDRAESGLDCEHRDPAGDSEKNRWTIRNVSQNEEGRASMFYFFRCSCALYVGST